MLYISTLRIISRKLRLFLWRGHVAMCTSMLNVHLNRPEPNDCVLFNTSSSVYYILILVEALLNGCLH